MADADKSNADARETCQAGFKLRRMGSIEAFNRSSCASAWRLHSFSWPADDEQGTGGLCMEAL